MKKIIKYKLMLKRGQSIQIDEDEISGLKTQLQEGGLVQVRQALFDASAFDVLLEDTERTESETYKIIDENGKINITSKRLEDIFKDTDDTKQLSMS